MMNTNQRLLKIDLVALVESSLGKIAEYPHGSWAKFSCPFCHGVRVTIPQKPTIVKSLLVINNGASQKGYFICHNCQASGDAITWLRKYKKLSYDEAIHALASAPWKHDREAAPTP